MDNDAIINYGLRLTQPKTKDYIYGADTKIKPVVLQSDGQWDKYMPVPEVQHSVYLDTMACVSFSALNCIETLFKRKFSYERNFSDRFTAKMSGTTQKGNYLNTVAESIRVDGLVDEDKWNYPREQRQPPFIWEEYYKDIPIEIKQIGVDFLNEYLIQYEWVKIDEYKPNLIMEALRYSPLQVVVHAWNFPVNNIYQRTDKTFTHAVSLIGYENNTWKIYDHYDKIIKYLSWDFNFSDWALKYNIEKLMLKTIKTKDNPSVYAISQKNELLLIRPDMKTYSRLIEAGIVSPTIEVVDSLETYNQKLTGGLKILTLI